MVDFFADSGNLHLRDTIFLNQTLVDEMKARGTSFGTTLYFVAREIVLSGAVINDRDVVLVADTVSSDAATSVPLTLQTSDNGKDGVLTQTGQVEPPIPVLGEPPQAGAAGPSLTVLCRTLNNGGAESHGQQGGKGLRGPFENRTACQMSGNPNLDPCAGMTKLELREMIGDPGGQGLPGAPGGPGGTIRVLCVQNLSGTTAGWLGVSGAGGYGGRGGQGGPNGKGGIKDSHNVIQRGPEGDPGVRPVPPPPVTQPVQVVSEATLAAEIAELTTAIRVGFETFEHHKIAALWAEFRRRQALEALRRRAFVEAQQALTAADRLFPPGPSGVALAARIRDNATAFAVERDLDVPADVPRFTDDIELAPRNIWSRLAGAIAPILVGFGTTTPKLLNADAIRETDTRLRALLADLVSHDEIVEHGNKARDRVELARQSRKDAHLTRFAVKERLDTFLNATAAAGVTIAIPAISQPLTVQALSELADALQDLAPMITSDANENSVPAPSNDAATLLPAQVDLLVNRSTRLSGVNGVLPAPVAGVVTGAMDVRHQVQSTVAWKAVRLPNTTGAAVNLAEVTAQLRAALRPTSGAPLTDPLRLNIVNGLIELAEAVRSWWLADLRLEQALAAQQLVSGTLAEAVAATGLPLPAAGTAAKDAVGTFLHRARALSDLLEWRWHRLERAFDIYTLGLRPVSIDRAAHAALFNPVFEADLTSNRLGEVPNTVAAFAAFKITSALDRISRAFVEPAWEAYDQRGDRTYTSNLSKPFPARRTFCLTADGTADCTVASPHVFAALRDPLQAGCWLDVDVADVQGSHREAKLRGAFVRITYALAPDGTTPSNTYQVELRHSGFSRQRELENGAEQRLTGLPQPMRFTLQRVPDQDGVPMSVWEGEISVDPPATPGAPDPRSVFPGYGRGVAAGYRLFLLDWSLAAPQLMTRLEVHIHYEARKPKGTASLQAVTLTSALRAGMTATARIELTEPAPAGGTLVKLHSSDPAAVSVPAQVMVPAGTRFTSVAVEVLKPTGPIPPSLSASTPDGVSRQDLAPVSRAPAIVPKLVVLGGAEDGTTYAVEVARIGPGTPGNPAAPVIFATRTSPVFDDEPVGGGPEMAVHALRADLSPLAQRQIGLWPRAIAVDAKRGRLYVVHGDTVSLLDAKTLASVATQLIGINASMIAVDVAAELVYVTRYSHGTVHVLRGADLSVVQVFGDKPTLRGCLGVAVHPSGGKLYVARNFRIDEPTATAVTSIVRRPDGSHVVDRDVTVGPVGLQPHAVAVDGPAGLVFVACQGGGGVHPTLLTLDATTLATVSSVVIPGPGMSVAARQGSGIAYVAAYSGLVLVDGRAGSVALTVKAGRHPQGVAVDQVTGTAYLTDRLDHTVTRIETPASVTATAWR